jgi:hypothetical protein
MFSPVAGHESSSPFSGEVLSRAGPKNSGQSAARTVNVKMKSAQRIRASMAEASIISRTAFNPLREEFCAKI